MVALRYDNPTKDTWRGWAWNQIEARAGRGRVCVLAGGIAGDLEHASRRGMECVGIDVQQKCVNHFRRSGGVAVKDSLHNQILAIQPRGLIADFCGGISWQAMAIAWDAHAVCDAMVINMQRGRDQGGDWVDYSVPHYIGRRVVIEPIGKHRGKQMAACIAKMAAETCGAIDKGEYIVPRWVFDELRPRYYSYRSKDSGKGNLYFDSVAVTTKAFQLQSRDLGRLRKTAPQKSRRLAAAAKALLTMRKN